jgi:signal transduction histidine kinase/ActR/RegA family two-component response regulator
MITGSSSPPFQASDWASPSLSEGSIRERVAYESVAGMMRATPFPIAVGLLFAAACGAVLLRASAPALVGAWFLALVVLTALRLWQVRRFFADPQRRVQAGRWQRRYLMLLVPYGLTWSAMLLLAGPVNSGFLFSFVIIGLLAVGSIGVYSVHGVFRVVGAWVLSVALPVTAWSLWRADADGLMLALGTVLLTSVTLHEARRNSRLQAALLRLRLENAAIAEDRTRALALAEQSNRAKTRFLATVSHEMRTPLNGIVGISELLRDGSSDPEVRHRADHLLSSAEQLHRVISDLLELSHLELGRPGPEPAPFDPAQALREVLDLARPEATERGLVLDMAIDPAVPDQVSGEVSRVKQVLHILLTNALRFTAAGRVSLTLQPRPQGLRYTVSDTGPGIAPGRLTTLFEPLGDTLDVGEARPQGVSLGLALARQLARAMGGDLACESMPGLGSRFVFTLQAVAVAGTAGPPDDEPAPPQFSGRVLVVDDNEVNALIAQAMLTRLGLASDIASDGEQALAQLASQRHDLVLMDCRMPVLDGWEATRRWRRLENQAHRARPLPILGVTANVSGEDRRHCLDCGMNGFLPKPFRLRELAQALQPHLRPLAAQAGGQSTA